MEELVDKLSDLLLEKKLKLVTAESCTGGMISAAITERAGSSSVFDRGFVTYSNEAKQENLGVSKNILDNYGAVSSQCADAMAKGALRNSNAEISVSVTGIAGPDGADNKPVGLVYIGVCAVGKKPQVIECHFAGSRHKIRAACCQKALEFLIEAVIAI